MLICNCSNPQHYVAHQCHDITVLDRWRLGLLWCRCAARTWVWWPWSDTNSRLQTATHSLIVILFLLSPYQ